MQNSTLLKSLAPLLCLGMAVFGARLCAQALTGPTPVGPHRPAGVPEGYVITPNGYFHPSCVKQLAKGDTVLGDRHAIQHVDGTLDNFTACNYPRYSFRGEAVTSGTAEPQVSGWVENASITTSTSFGGIIGAWTVPPKPTSNDGQTLFFFPGLEDIHDVVTILQPVLEWNAFSNYSGWSIASWNCCYDNVDLYSSPMGVSSGDSITGEIFSNCDPGTLSCTTWSVSTENAAKGYTALSSTSSYGQTFNWAFGGVLEVGSSPGTSPVVQCSDYPPNGSVAFEAFVYDENFLSISDPNWIAGYGPSGTDSSPSGLTPQCGYDVQFPEGYVTLYY